MLHKSVWALGLWLVLAALSIAQDSPLPDAKSPRAKKAEPKKPEPALVVQVKPYDGLIADVKYIARLVNRPDLADQVEGAAGAYIGEKGPASAGVDAARPILAYVVAEQAERQPFAVMLPVADEDVLLQFLKQRNVAAQKGDDGVYKLDLASPLGGATYLKFAHRYAYFSIDKRLLLEDTLFPPEKLAAEDAKLVLGVTLFVDRINEETKQIILGQIENRLADVRDRDREGESDNDRRRRRDGINAMSQLIKTVMTDGKSLAIQLNVDRQNDDLGLHVAFEGKPLTILSQSIIAMGGNRTRFAAADGAALHVGLNLSVPLLFRPFIGMAVDNGIKDVIAREADPQKREVTEKLALAVAPTLKRGVIDLHLAAGGPGADGFFNLLLALAVENGHGIETALKLAVERAPEEIKSRVALDAQRKDDLSIHKIALRDKELPADAKRTVGNANLWAGFSNVAVMVGLGAEPEAMFRGVTARNEPAPSPAVLIEASLRRLAALDKARPNAVELANKAFGPESSGNDRIRVSLEGGSKLKFDVAVKGKVLHYFTLIGEHDRQSQP